MVFKVASKPFYDSMNCSEVEFFKEVICALEKSLQGYEMSEIQ